MKLNETLIEAMKARLSPVGDNLANILMEILCIGKEAVYRRLRGEVPFSLDEAAIITQYFKISLDNVIGTRRTSNALFDLNIVDADNPLATYAKILEQYTVMYKKIKDYEYSDFQTATNLMPQSFYLRFDQISRFRLFKWLYQNGGKKSVKHLSDLVIPDDIRSLQKKYVYEAQYIRTTTYVLDNLIFLYFINDIKYFINIHLIEKEDIKLLKEDLLYMLDELEKQTSEGMFKATGSKLQIYVSNVNFEASYGYLSCPLFNVAIIRLYSINAMMSVNPDVFNHHADWVQSLKKYSTMISESAETQRIQFFKTQRNLVKELG